VHATLRQATAADAPRVADLLIVVRAATAPFAPSAHADDAVQDWVASRLVPSGGAVVAEIRGSVVAVMHTEHRQAISWITQLAVDPKYSNCGVGSLLLAHALRTLAPPLRLYTFQANLGARRFYERHGFRAVAFSAGQTNEEHCPDVLYEFTARDSEVQGMQS
jgi:ribosomal protein S18 acetylase RimI-like enzyme